MINASAYRAFLLFSAAEQFGRDDYAQAARRNLNFVLRAQRPDGSWCYAIDGVRDFVDHFHTCFVLKALAKIEALTGDAGCREAIEAGVAYYVAHLFDDQAAAPALRRGATADRLPARAVRLRRVHQPRHAAARPFPRTRRTAREHPGRPARALAQSRRLVPLAASCMFGWDNVPMHRWAQAQMFRSLAFLLARESGQLGRDAGPSAPATHPAPVGQSVAGVAH